MSEPKMAELAKRIDAHLKRFESDSEINVPRRRLPPYYRASANYHKGRYISVIYIAFQGAMHITRDEAVRYLAALDGGFVGRHFEALR